MVHSSIIEIHLKEKCSRESDNNPMSYKMVPRACLTSVSEIKGNPGLTAPSLPQSEASVAGSRPLMPDPYPSSPQELCSFSSSSPSLSFSSRPSLPPEHHLPPNFPPFPSCPPCSFSSSSFCPLRWLPGLPSSSLDPTPLLNSLNIRINNLERNDHDISLKSLLW